MLRRYTLIFIFMLFISNSCFAQENPAPVRAAYMQPAQPTMPIQLNNGLTVIIQEDHRLPIVSVYAVYKAGVINETAADNGVTYLLQKLLKQNNKLYPAGRVDFLLSSFGAQYGAYTCDDLTCFYETAPKDALDTCLKIERDRMSVLYFEKQEIEKQKKEILREIPTKQNNPRGYLYQNVIINSSPKQPYGLPITGTAKSIRGLGKKQVEAYYKKYFACNNAALFIRGDIKPDEVLAKVKKMFGYLKPGKNTAIPARAAATTETVENFLEEGPVNLCQTSFFTPGADDPDTAALLLLKELLGGGPNSILYKSLVDSGLASYTGVSQGNEAGNLFINKNTQLFNVFIAPNSASIDKIFAAAQAGIEKTKNNISADEFAYAKNKLRYKLQKNTDSLAQKSFWSSYYAALGSYGKLDDILAAIENISADDLRAAAAKYLTKENSITGVLKNNFTNTVGAAYMQPLQTSDEQLVGTAHCAVLTSNAFSADIQTPNDSSYLALSKITLPNGLTVLLHTDKEAQAVTIYGEVFAGSICDPEGKYGLSDITNRLWASSCADIAKACDGIGAEMALYISEVPYYSEMIKFKARSSVKNYADTLSLLAGCLQNKNFDKNNFENIAARQRVAAMEKLNSFELKKLNILYNQNLPKGHPYNHYYLGNAGSLNNITCEDAAEFYKTYYRPNNTILAVTGNITPEELKNALEAAFGSWQKGDIPVVGVPLLCFASPKVNIQVKDDSPGNYDMVFTHKSIPRNSPDYYAMNVLNYSLGGYPYKNRLMEALVNKGADYGYSAMPVSNGESFWQIRVHFTKLDNVGNNIDTVSTVLNKIINKGVSDKELEAAKKYFTGRFAVLMDDPETRARMMLNIDYYGLGLDYFEKYNSYYNGLTKEKLREAAAKYIKPECLNVLVIRE